MRKPSKDMLVQLTTPRPGRLVVIEYRDAYDSHVLIGVFELGTRECLAAFNHAWTESDGAVDVSTVEVGRGFTGPAIAAIENASDKLLGWDLLPKTERQRAAAEPTP